MGEGEGGVERERERGEVTPPRIGSEYRVGVVALMLANKFVDE